MKTVVTIGNLWGQSLRSPHFWSWLWSLISSEHYPDSSLTSHHTTQGYCHCISNLQIRKWRISGLMQWWIIQEDRANRMKTQGTTAVYILVKSTEVTSWQRIQGHKKGRFQKRNGHFNGCSWETGELYTGCKGGWRGSWGAEGGMAKVKMFKREEWRHL